MSSPQAEVQQPAAKRQKTSKIIGTHNGTFHCDEALAVYLLRRTTTYRDAALVRTRTPSVLDTCDIVVDVGGVYDVQSQRFDHHQRGFEQVFGEGFDIKLSSAGLVYLHFGQEIIANTLEIPSQDPKIRVLWLKLYKEYIAAIDAIDNGIPQFPTTLVQGAAPKYRISSDVSARVGHLNPAWNEKCSDDQIDEKFGHASNLVGNEWMSHLQYYSKAWLPAREILIKAIETSKEREDKDGRLIVLDEYVPWKEHLFDLEVESIIPPNQALYVVYSDGSSWRVQCVPTSPSSFESRKPLPAAWCGLRDDALTQESAIEGGVFVHASGFIGGNKTREGALEMAWKSLKM